MSAIEAAEAVRLYGTAWSEPDEGARRATLETCWADDGVYCDPTARADGRDALVAHIGGFLQGFAGHRIETTSEVDEHDGFLRFTWRMLGPDGSTVMEGVDFGRTAADGRLELIVGFFGPVTPAS